MIINKEMGITHSEFLRLLPIALRHDNYHVDVDGITITIPEPERQLSIQLSPQEDRVIASIRLPVTNITLEFKGFTEQQQTSFLRQFDNTYRRGGG